MEQRNYGGIDGGNVGGASGWTTTEVAAEALGVSARTVRNYIQRGDLAAKEGHEGITDRYLAWKTEARGERNGGRASEASETQGNDTTELLRETIACLGTRAEQNTELRTRLQLTTQSESILREACERPDRGETNADDYQGARGLGRRCRP